VPGRFDARPLIGGLVEGLRKRRTWGDEPADRKARIILVGVPAAAFILTLVFGVELVKADQLFAGAALFSGALLGAFSQVANWRDRLLARERKVDAVYLRALDEAAAHILFAVLVSASAALALIVVTNVDLVALHRHRPAVLVVRVASAYGTAALAYLALTLVIVVNLLWDAYVGAGKASGSASGRGRNAA